MKNTETFMEFCDSLDDKGSINIPLMNLLRHTFREENEPIIGLKDPFNFKEKWEKYSKYVNSKRLKAEGDNIYYII